MATHSSILAWRITWTEEPGALQSIGSKKVTHDGNILVHTHVYSASPSWPALRGLRPGGSLSAGVRASAPGYSAGVPVPGQWGWSNWVWRVGLFSKQCGTGQDWPLLNGRVPCAEDGWWSGGGGGQVAQEAPSRLTSVPGASNRKATANVLPATTASVIFNQNKTAETKNKPLPV